VPDDFEALTAAIRQVFPESRLEPATQDQLAAIRSAYPQVPGHYLEFLRRVGWGSLGSGNFMIYSGMCEPGDIFDEMTAVKLRGLLLVGDDFAGWLLGFDRDTGWRMVGVNNGSLDGPVRARTLVEFIAQRVADRRESFPM
jgi:hypothetical protein